MSILQENSQIAKLYDTIVRKFCILDGMKDRAPSNRWLGREDELNLSQIPDFHLKPMTPEEVQELKTLAKDLQVEIVNEIQKASEEDMSKGAATRWTNLFSEIGSVIDLLDWHNIFIEREDPKNAPGAIIKREDEKKQKEKDWIRENVRAEKQEEVLGYYDSFSNREIQNLFWKDLKKNKGKMLPQEVYRIWKVREKKAVEKFKESDTEKTALNTPQYKTLKAYYKVLKLKKAAPRIFDKDISELNPKGRQHVTISHSLK